MTDYLARSITELKSLHVSVTKDLEHMPNSRLALSGIPTACERRNTLNASSLSLE